MKFFFQFFLLIIYSLHGNAQGKDIPIGNWRVHVSYREGLSLTESQGQIYYAAKGGFFTLNKSDNSYDLLSKVNGLSDATFNVVNSDPVSGTVVVAYTNSNIDVIQNNVITNISDIKRKNIPGNKAINNIYFNSGYAYLACGFGIVVLDLTNLEVKDTYYIGPLGASINVHEITSNSTNLFAATASGIYTAALTGANLADYNSWSKVSGLPAGNYNGICFLSGNVYANFSKGTYLGDSIFVYNGTSWSNFVWTGGYDTKKMNVCNGQLVIAFDYNVDVYDGNQILLNRISNYGFDFALPLAGVVDAGNNVWIADAKYGLVRSSANGSGERYLPNGPRTNAVFALSYSNKKVVSAPGGNGIFNTDGVSVFNDNSWSTIYGVQPGGNMDTLHDIVCIANDPDNENRFFACSNLHGLLEFRNGSMVNVFNPSNSSLKNQENAPNYYAVRVGGAGYDTDGNLWMSNGETDNAISVRKKNGTWQSFDFTGYVDKYVVGQLLVSKDNQQKWVVLTKQNSILTYRDNGTFATPNNSNTKVLTTAKGNGSLPGAKVNCIAEDDDAQIWIGTNVGVAVISSQDNIFGGGNFDAQQIYVEQDGHAQILLETEEVTSIAIDGANRKWIGTTKAGVFLMSADGTKEVYHFTAENSPLLSNEITAITINDETGEVFFGTPNGTVSYRSTATEGGEDFENVYAFPNPVKHDYTGVIAIKGLVKNAEVKITDVAGNLIYQTKAEGGQAIWSGTNFKGERAHTGVYFVYCANEDGSKTFVTKILFIN